MEQENNEKKEIEFGTLYDINKNIVKQNEIKLSEGVLNSKKQIITDFIKNVITIIICYYATKEKIILYSVGLIYLMMMMQEKLLKYWLMNA